MTNSLDRPRPRTDDLADEALFDALVSTPIEYLRWILRRRGAIGWFRGDEDTGFNTARSVQQIGRPKPQELEVRIEKLSAITDRGTPIEIVGPIDRRLHCRGGKAGSVVQLTVDWQAPPQRAATSASEEVEVERSPYRTPPAFALTLNPGDAEHVPVSILRGCADGVELDPSFLPPAVTVGSSDVVSARARALVAPLERLASFAPRLLARARETDAAHARADVEGARSLLALWRAQRCELTDPAVSTRRFLRACAALVAALDCDLRDGLNSHGNASRDEFDGLIADLEPDASGFARIERAIDSVIARWEPYVAGGVNTKLAWRSLRVERVDRWHRAELDLARPLRELLPEGSNRLEIEIETSDLGGAARPLIEVRVSLHGEPRGRARACSVVQRSAGRLRVKCPLNADESSATHLTVWILSEIVSPDQVQRLQVLGGQ